LPNGIGKSSDNEKDTNSLSSTISGGGNMNFLDQIKMQRQPSDQTKYLDGKSNQSSSVDVGNENESITNNSNKSNSAGLEGEKSGAKPSRRHSVYRV